MKERGEHDEVQLTRQCVHHQGDEAEYPGHHEVMRKGLNDPKGRTQADQEIEPESLDRGLPRRTALLNRVEPGNQGDPDEMRNFERWKRGHRK